MRVMTANGSVSSNWTVDVTTAGVGQPPLSPRAPPKMGFVPREDTIHLRDDIRRLQLTNSVTSDSLSSEASMDGSANNCNHYCSDTTADSTALDVITTTPHGHDTVEKLRPEHSLSAMINGTTDSPTAHTLVTKSRDKANGELHFLPAHIAAYSSSNGCSQYSYLQPQFRTLFEYKERENGRHRTSNTDRVQHNCSMTVTPSEMNDRDCSKSNCCDVEFDSLRAEADLTCF